MQRRQVAVAHEMLNRGCEHVVEVGGYLTPLDALLRDLAWNFSYKLPKSYINIDPSVKMPMDVTVDGMRSVHIPMTLADFTNASAMQFRHAFKLSVRDLHVDASLSHSTDKICAVILSVWDPHVATSNDREALRQLFHHVGFLAASAADDEMEHLSVVKLIAEVAHDLKPTQNEQVFDCSKELSSEKSHWPGDQVEHLDYLSGGGPDVSKLLTASWSAK